MDLETAFSQSSIVLKLITACPVPSEEMFDVFILLCIIKFETSLQLSIFLLEPDIKKNHSQKSSLNLLEDFDS